MRSLIFMSLSVLALAACEPVQTSSTTRIASGEQVAACKALGGLAETIMEVRQTGVSQRELTDVTNVYTRGKPELRGLSDGIIQAAYSIPIEPTTAGRNAVTQQFSRITVDACVDALAT